MVHNNFCPFVNGACRSDCVFNCGHYIAMSNGTDTQCELAAFITLSDSESINTIAEEVQKLISNK